MQAQLGLTGYTDAEEIGRGGFGVVYRARQVSLDRPVAIKVLPSATMGEQTRKRFERECRAMAALADHPNIVSIFDHGIAEESGRPYIVMEYVPGGSLAGRGALSWERALEIGIKLCGALETAHRAGILHRDLKPENVLVSAFGQAKLADFGVAKVQDSSETPTGNITASILHAAPELLTGQRPEVTTDIYSLASTIYSLILGTAPFARPDEESLAPLITRICLEPPPDLTSLGVPAPVAALLERGMAKEPAARFASAKAFGEAMQQAQRELGLPVTELHVATDIAVAADAPTLPTPRAAEAVQPDATTAARKLTPTELGLVGRGSRKTATGSGRRRPSGKLMGAFAVLLLLALTGGGFLVANAHGNSHNSTSTLKVSPIPSTSATLTPTPGASPTKATKSTTSKTRKPASKTTTGTAVGGGSTNGGGGNPTDPGPTITATLTQTPSVGTGPLPPPPPPVDRAPSVSATNQSSNETIPVNATFTASDPDPGDHATVTSVTGLPAGLSASNGHISGAALTSDANNTANWHSIQSVPFYLTVTATDTHGKTATAHVIWTVHDTTIVMPDYIDKFGCGFSCDGIPNISDLSDNRNTCAYDPNGDAQRIWQQSVPAGRIIAWGQTITYWYGKKDTTCAHIPKGV